MNYDIHSTLEQMESNLKKVDSARQQVSNVVNACNELIDAAQRLVANIDKITIKSNALLAEAQKEVENLRIEVLKLDKIHTTIQTVVSDINSLKAQVKTLLEELQSSQAAQGRTLEDISTSISAMQTSLQSAHDKLNYLRSEILEKFAKQEAALSQATDAIQADIQESKSALHSDIKQLQNITLEQVITAQTKLSKEIKMNHYLLVGVIIIMLGILVKLFI